MELTVIPPLHQEDREERFLRLRPGHVTELLGVPGTGLTRLGLTLLAERSQTAPVVALDTRGWISPAAAWETGVAPENLVIVRCDDPAIWPKVAAALLESLEPEADENEIELAWREEVRRRVESIDRGEVQLIPWENVRDELLARLNDKP